MVTTRYRRNSFHIWPSGSRTYVATIAATHTRSTRKYQTAVATDHDGPSPYGQSSGPNCWNAASTIPAAPRTAARSARPLMSAGVLLSQIGTAECMPLEQRPDPPPRDVAAKATPISRVGDQPMPVVAATVTAIATTSPSAAPAEPAMTRHRAGVRRRARSTSSPATITAGRNRQPSDWLLASAAAMPTATATPPNGGPLFARSPMTTARTSADTSIVATPRSRRTIGWNVAGDCWERVNAIRPSAPQEPSQTESVVAGLRLRSRRSLPSAAIDQICVPSGVHFVKAIRDPSGDHAGHRFPSGSNVSCVGLLPAAFITQMLAMPEASDV